MNITDNQIENIKEKRFKICQELQLNKNKKYFILFKIIL